MKTIKDIVEEMRNLAQRYKQFNEVIPRRHMGIMLTRYADNIEKAVTNCNQLKMREALKEIRATLSVYDTSSLSNQETIDTFENVIEQALSSPPRNCDRFSNARDALKEYEKETGSTIAIEFIKWLFEEVKGETK